MRRGFLILTLTLLLAASLPAVSALTIVEFYPDTYLPGDADAYLVIEGNGSLSRVTLYDGEGTLSFPEGAEIRGRITVADEGLAYRAVHGALPDFELRNTTSLVSDVVKTGRYAPANDGDELVLSVEGRVVQSIRWPGDLVPREGQVHFLTGAGWDPRVLLLGQSRFTPAIFGNATVTAYVSPDSSFGVLREAVSRARQEVLVNAYELTHPGIADLLAGARGRGVRVEVLLEGGPVGGISREEEAVCAALNLSGIPLSRMTTTEAAHARYRYNHAKYLVIDGTSVLISTENFGFRGYPLPGTRGNRGWGVLIEDPGIARYFGEVFSADLTGGDVIPYTPSPGIIPSLSPPSYPVQFPALTATGVTVHPVLSPDTSSEVVSLLAGAESRIDIEQASIRNGSGMRLDPFLAEAVKASRRGVAVRVLLDGSMYNDEGPADNDEMAELVNAIARDEGLPISARVLEPEAGNFYAVHTKGIIVDGRRVLVSSINWNGNSPNFNREAGVILESPAIGGYFSTVFEEDWNRAGAGAGSPGPDPMKLGLAGVVTALLLLLFLARRRR